jgi:hypothetical protein
MATNTMEMINMWKEILKFDKEEMVQQIGDWAYSFIPSKQASYYDAIIDNEVVYGQLKFSVEFQDNEGYEDDAELPSEQRIKLYNRGSHQYVGTWSYRNGDIILLFILSKKKPLLDGNMWYGDDLFETFSEEEMKDILTILQTNFK